MNLVTYTREDGSELRQVQVDEKLARLTAALVAFAWQQLAVRGRYHPDIAAAVAAWGRADVRWLSDCPTEVAELLAAGASSAPMTTAQAAEAIVGSSNPAGQKHVLRLLDRGVLLEAGRRGRARLVQRQSVDAYLARRGA